MCPSILVIFMQIRGAHIRGEHSNFKDDWATSFTVVGGISIIPSEKLATENSGL